MLAANGSCLINHRHASQQGQLSGRHRTHAWRNGNDAWLLEAARAEQQRLAGQMAKLRQQLPQVDATALQHQQLLQNITSWGAEQGQRAGAQKARMERIARIAAQRVAERGLQGVQLDARVLGLSSKLGRMSDMVKSVQSRIEEQYVDSPELLNTLYQEFRQEQNQAARDRPPSQPPQATTQQQQAHHPNPSPVPADQGVISSTPSPQQSVSEQYPRQQTVDPMLLQNFNDPQTLPRNQMPIVAPESPQQQHSITGQRQLQPEGFSNRQQQHYNGRWVDRIPNMQQAQSQAQPATQPTTPARNTQFQPQPPQPQTVMDVYGSGASQGSTYGAVDQAGWQNHKANQAQKMQPTYMTQQQQQQQQQNWQSPPMQQFGEYKQEYEQQQQQDYLKQQQEMMMQRKAWLQYQEQLRKRRTASLVDATRPEPPQPASQTNSSMFDTSLVFSALSSGLNNISQLRGGNKADAEQQQPPQQESAQQQGSYAQEGWLQTENMSAVDLAVPINPMAISQPQQNSRSIPKPTNVGSYPMQPLNANRVPPSTFPQPARAPQIGRQLGNTAVSPESMQQSIQSASTTALYPEHMISHSRNEATLQPVVSTSSQQSQRSQNQYNSSDYLDDITGWNDMDARVIGWTVASSAAQGVTSLNRQRKF